MQIQWWEGEVLRSRATFLLYSPLPMAAGEVRNRATEEDFEAIFLKSLLWS
jgi:hypothetical protein